MDISAEFEDKVSSVLNTCPPCSVFLAAVSGGADSMAMLVSLSVLVERRRLFCLHVEHGLRPIEESHGDAAYVSDFCARRGINCRVESIPRGKIVSLARRGGMGIEAAARFFRREALLEESRRIAGENVFILTAHTKDDALETALMRVLRGCGPAGLAFLPAGRGQFLRPLLEMSRADVTGYLKEKKISWREDSTNTDEKYLRNKIRWRLVPLLEDAFPSWKTGVASFAKTQSLAASFIADEAEKRVKWERAGDILFTDEDSFFAQPLVIREEALFQAIDAMPRLRDAPGERKNKSIRRSVVRKFCLNSAKAADLGQLTVRRGKGKVVLSFNKRILANGSRRDL